MRTLQALIEAAAERFQSDRIKPGVVISDLGDGLVYASIKRYPHGLNSGEVVCSVKIADLEGAIENLGRLFLASCGRQKSALERLAEALP